MKAAVYNRYWSSFGGGERHAGRVAAVLASDGAAVDLLGPEYVDPAELGARLGLDLSGVSMRVVPDYGDPVLARTTQDYDLFVNGSYMSRLVARARRNVYLCYFPTPTDHDLGPAQRFLLRRAGRLLAERHRPFDHGLGWFPPEGGRRRRWAWTNGDGILIVPEGTEPVIDAELARVGVEAPVTLHVVDESGREWAQVAVNGEFTRHRFKVGSGPGPAVVHLRSDTFVPGDGDTRSLGVAVSRLRVGSRRSFDAWLAFQFPWLLRDPGNLAFLAAYDRVLANSEYTRSWIARLWGVDADVLFPPVQLDRMPPASRRAPVIAVVGRFFGPRFGHSKRQLEMVRIFGELTASLPGWRMQIIGGCEPSQEPYLRSVQAAAAGLPVDVVANAPREEVERLYSTASIFWSATGLGENEQRRPWTFEHFGITTVEAMSGGAVPLVIDRAGQREIVRDGQDGFRWRTPAELRARTLQLATDPALLARLSASARTRAGEFSEEAFDRRLRTILAAVEVSGRR
ncbi:MAG: glycosyltransferase family 4 protein [Mycobacteriales bacterium]